MKAIQEKVWAFLVAILIGFPIAGMTGCEVEREVPDLDNPDGTINTPELDEETPQETPEKHGLDQTHGNMDESAVEN